MFNFNPSIFILRKEPKESTIEYLYYRRKYEIKTNFLLGVFTNQNFFFI